MLLNYQISAAAAEIRVTYFIALRANRHNIFLHDFATMDTEIRIDPFPAVQASWVGYHFTER